MKSSRRSASTYQLAMDYCLLARESEFVAPLQLANLQPNEVLVDFPSADGYLRYWVDQLPVPVNYQSVENVSDYKQVSHRVQAGNWNDLPFPDQSVDVMYTLAALHHVYPKRSSFYHECHRILKSNGRLVIADVAEGTKPACFLSEFVSNNSPEGHDAMFFAKDTDSTEINTCGFSVNHFDVHELPWFFDSKEQAIYFCKNLFRLTNVDDSTMWEALNDFLGTSIDDGRIRLFWELALIRANKQ